MSLLFGWDPPLDLDTTLICVQAECLARGDTFHPEIAEEVESPQGGAVYYASNAFECPLCRKLGEEIAA